MDVAKDINEIKFTASLTDASARDYEATPWIRDFIVSAEKKLNCTSRSPLVQVAVIRFLFIYNKSRCEVVVRPLG